MIFTRRQSGCLGRHTPTPPDVLTGHQGPDNDNDIADGENDEEYEKEYDDHLSLVIIEHDKFSARVASFRGVRARHRREADKKIIMHDNMMMMINVTNTTLPMVAR